MCIKDDEVGEIIKMYSADNVQSDWITFSRFLFISRLRRGYKAADNQLENSSNESWRFTYCLPQSVRWIRQQTCRVWCCVLNISIRNSYQLFAEYLPHRYWGNMCRTFPTEMLKNPKFHHCPIKNTCKNKA